LPLSKVDVGLKYGWAIEIREDCRGGALAVHDRDFSDKSQEAYDIIGCCVGNQAKQRIGEDWLIVITCFRVLETQRPNVGRSPPGSETFARILYDRTCQIDKCPPKVFASTGIPVPERLPEMSHRNVM